MHEITASISHFSVNDEEKKNDDHFGYNHDDDANSDEQAVMTTEMAMLIKL